MKNNYILYVEGFESKTRPRMSRAKRAAQFAPFAALSGYGEAIDETMRFVGEKLELSEDETDELERRTREILAFPDERICVTYFVPDRWKKGGAYVTKSGFLRNIDTIKRLIVMEDKTLIPLDSVIDIYSEACVR